MNMTIRTPSFIVVGLLIVIFVLGSLYMSCSSTTAELKRTLEEFEERIRTLSLKNSEHEREIVSINNLVQELELKKSDLQKELEKNDLELEDINKKLNEKSLELQTLKLDKQLLDDQLLESKNVNDALGSKTLAIEKLQQELQDQQKLANEQIKVLTAQIENYKHLLNESQMNHTQLLFESRLIQSFLSTNQTYNISLYQGIAEIPSNTSGENNITLSNLVSNETIFIVNQTDSTNITNPEIQFNSTEFNSTMNNSSIDQKLMNPESDPRLQQSIGSLSMGTQILNATNASTSTTLDHISTETYSTNTATVVHNLADQLDAAANQNNDYKDDLVVNVDRDQHVDGPN